MTEYIPADVSDTDIAIVGVAGRFPGAADVAGLWAAIRAGRSGITRFTDEELRAAGVPEEQLADPAYVKAGAVIDGYDRFDAGFFGINPKEAQILDPQHRLFLEHSWHALEDASCDPARFDGTIGVFGGAGLSSYLINNLLPAGVAGEVGEFAVGLANDKDSLPLRVAHTLGLTGPAYGIQSYCSTSLVAVCAAATSLANLECDMALAGGVALGVPHRVGYPYQQGGITPPDGECRAFDASGLGAPLGSGVGVVALRRLEDALADGDRVYAVLRGWAVNNDGGRKVGFTAPGVEGQAAVIAEALAAAGFGPADIDYIEAHGTGTALGDAAEIAALQQVFDGEQLLVGSVKTNVGHLDRAAGVTGLIKAALALHHGEIPPTRNFTTPNPQLAAGGARLTVVTEPHAWPRGATPRRAGVSAFGIGGTNAHVVLEEAPLPAPAPAAPRPAELLVWSGRSAEAADASARALAGHLEESAGALAHVAHTLQSGRGVFGHRRMLVAGTADEAAARLREGDVLSRVDGQTDRPVGFLIAGTGEQYPGMAAELYETEPVFRSVIDHCRTLLVEQTGADPLTALLAPRATAPGGADLGRLLGRTGAPEGDGNDATDRLQPALFAVEYALAQLVRSWGVEPSVMVGYSLGEYVAACLAGVLSVEDALALVAHRARLIHALPAGAMAAVPLSADEVRARIVRTGLDGLDIAAVNGPGVTVVSGEPAALDTFREALAEDTVPCRPLATTHAFHSRMLEPIRAGLTDWIATHVTLHPPAIPYVSNVTGELITDAQATDPAYWAEHMCGPVRFDDAVATLLTRTETALLEIGPGPSLGALVRGHAACPPDRWPLIVQALPAEGDPRPAATVLAEAVGRLWLAGVSVDWTGYQEGRAPRAAELPLYPFQRERYWIDAPAGRTGTTGPQPAETTAPAPHVQLLTQRWDPAGAPESIATAPADGHHVLIADAGGTAGALAALLRREGTQVTVVRPGEDLPADGRTVVHLAALDSADASAGVLSLSRTLAALGADGAGTTRVVVVTRGGQTVADGEQADPAQAAVAVLPVVANQEYLNLDTSSADLAPGSGAAEAAEALAALLRHPTGTVTAAHRDGRWHVPGYVPAEAGEAAGDALPDPAVVEGTTWLITGGLGDVGITLAEHLVRRGATTLILTSRNGVPDDPDHPRAAAVRRLRELGAEIRTPLVDVTDEAAMRALFDADRIDGVVHAAAESAPDTFRPLQDLDAAAVARHFGAKVDGARVLDAVVSGLPAARRPAHCVLFSSTSALLGGLAFGSYAAANAALTALAHRRTSTTTRWTAASWDTWACTLDRLDGQVGATMISHSMSDPEALGAFDALLDLARPAVIVVAGGLADRLPVPAGAATAPAAATATRYQRPDLPQPYVPPLTATERVLAGLWSDVLGVEPIGVRDNFFDLQGNSLLALQMLNLVKQRFGIVIPTVTLFAAPTVHALGAALDEQGAAATGTPAAPVAAAPAPRTEPSRPAAAAEPDHDLDRHIAVVGMAGRFPGAADVTQFWRNLCDGVESITFFSPEELIEAGVDPALVHDPSYVPARAVLDDIAGFDAGFFGLSPRMAALTDPQQRLFLETCWEALEQSGYCRPEHRGRVGVFGGTNISTYLLGMADRLAGDEDVSTYEIIMGNDKDALTTSVSYLFDLRGPSVAVQTFCSTSLVAVHTAARALRAGDCEMALAGGVSIRVPDRVGHLYTAGGQESVDGHVRTFDSKAQGSMFGDGATVVVLKRLSDALRDGDHIWSVIRGSAMNNDGALKVGYTAPSVIGQAQVIADAMADARVTAEDIGYVEAHGTATELGDPIEVAALTRAFGPTDTRQYCALGSVKTNIGHLDRAAGTAGLIKASLAVREGVIPATLHYTSPNPEIDFENSPFYVNAGLTHWEAGEGRPRIAGLNSLGMGGTNVHVVVEEPPARPETAPAAPESARRYQVLPVSARTTAAADEAVQRLGEHLRTRPETRLDDTAFTLQVGRKTFEHRRAAVVTSVEEAVPVLTGADGAAPLAARTDAAQGRPVAFLFAGVGEQYPGLVGELYRREPEFAAALDACLDRISAALPDGDVADLLTGVRGGAQDLAVLLGRATATDERAAAMRRTEVAQPLMFAVDYALARTLMAWGVRPQAMLGYSLGEYVAACLAGVLSLDDALALVVHRARLIAGAERGTMAAVPLSADALRRRFRIERRGLDIAAVNGPDTVVVAGPDADMALLAEELRKAEVPYRPLETTHAFHSRMLGGLTAELTAWIEANVTLHAPELLYYSNVTGGVADADLVRDPGYWARHMCGTVEFAAGAAGLIADPELAVVEIGPGPSLGALMRAAACPPERWPMITATLPAAGDPRPADAVLADCLARLWLLGVDVDWAAHHGRGPGAATPAPGRAPGRIPLPTYPFQRQRYWIERSKPSPQGAIGAPATGAPAEPMSMDDIGKVPKQAEEEWLYLPVWHQTAPTAADGNQPAHWLVYAREGAADRALDELRRTVEPAGATVTVLRPGDTHGRTEDGWTVRPGSDEDTLAVLRALRSAGHRLERVVHLWTLGEEAGDTEAGILNRGLDTLIALARAAGELGFEDWTLDIATTGSQQVLDGSEARPASATVTGPALVIPLEYPTVTTRLIDTDPATTAAALVAELRRPRAAATVALRGNRRWLCTYEQLPAAPGTETGGAAPRDGGVYLITGGLGGIGLGMADHLAREHRAKLVLFGRTGLPPRERWEAVAAGTEAADDTTRRRVTEVLGLLAHGAEVEIVTGDVADPADVRGAVDRAVERFGALHGLLHTAGVPGTGLMQFKQPGDGQAVLASKIAGCRAIAEALRIGRPDELHLDFLVLFSSITSVTGGGPGQVDYCAGNAYLDAFANSLAADGRRVLSVDWGEWTWNAWSNGLAGYEESLQTFFRNHRAHFGITFDDGWRSLLRALGSGESRVVVSTQDFPTVVRFSTRFTVATVTSEEVTGGTGSRHPRPELVTPYQEPSGTVEQTIAGIWGEALRLDRTGVNDNFFELGGSSLLGITVLAALRRAFPDAELPPHILFEAPTVTALAKVVDAEAAGPAPAQDREATRNQAERRRSGLEAAARRRKR
ncbi:type I polyketide synthase [Streptomyces sp. TBY4]|uniref:type I polyketide synthase n=1 Tax=Streptomyces sp. TBY4 TaxID=2962030 RepID=UPI0020B89C04|nr:type I polyketide synthase [Streptomyces sp. TBY4]MCP3760506.1 SDR family NAD(P)-dependent oxidoreductase [Streptomyces sp. TBY4]